MKRNGTNNYALGLRLVALRNQTGLTQTELGHLIGVSRRSILKWESGEGVPNGTHLHDLLEVFVDRKAFTADQELTEAEALWNDIGQATTKRLGQFNSHWFAQLVATRERGRSEQPTLINQDAPSNSRSLSSSSTERPDGAVIDWGEAIDVPALYGRDAELSQLRQWILQERCRVVALLGLGGIGKTSLALTFAREALPHFEAVVFRSLQNGPPLAELVDDVIRRFSLSSLPLPDALSDKIALLVQTLRQRRCLLILDNLESLMQPEALAGTYRADHAAYATLFQALGTRAHESCLLLTSREKPAELGMLEGRAGPVHTLAVSDLNDTTCQIILEAKDIVGIPADVQALGRLYGGNPLALQLIAEPIRGLFGGNVAAFLASGDAFFNGVGILLKEQFARSTALEQSILRWLAIKREFVSLDDLVGVLSPGVPQRAVLVALESLRHRTLIECAIDRPAFTLQPVILEYITDQLVELLWQEIVDMQPQLLLNHGVILATAKDYIRRSQERMIATPVLERLMRIYTDRATIEKQLQSLLRSWRGQPPGAQHYGPGNLVSMLRLLRGDLRGLDLSQLALRGVYLQGVEMQDATLAGSTIRDHTFTETFDSLLGVDVSRDGRYWAAGSRRGELLLWSAHGLTLHPLWSVYADMWWALAFSPDGSAVASSGSWDGTVKVWDTPSGSLRWVGRHTSQASSVAFAPDGRRLASGGSDMTIRIWDAQSGAQLQELSHRSPVSVVTWSPHGYLLASSDVEGSIQLWDMQTLSVRTLTGHATWVDGLSFAPDGNLLASASWDGTVKVWDVASGQLRATLTGHSDRVSRVAWSPDGGILASSSRDQTLWLWDVVTKRYRGALYGHTAGVVDLAFLPDGRSLISASEDGTLRVWDVANRQCLRVIEGYTSSLHDVDWSPDSTQVVCGSADRLVTVYDLTGATLPHVLRGHEGVGLSVGWSASGRWIASSEWDNVVRLWDPRSGVCLKLLHIHADDTAFIHSLAWSPDGQRLACATYRHGVYVFEVEAGQQHWVAKPLATGIQRTAWSPDGQRLVGAGEDGTVYLWDAADGKVLQRLAGHHSTITCVTWNTTGTMLASGASNELFVWDAQRGERLSGTTGHSAMVSAVAWGANEHVLISGDSEGTLRWWNIQNETSIHLREAHQGAIQAIKRSPDGTKLASCGDDGAMKLWDLSTGDYLQTVRSDRPYERMDITGLTGITPAQRASLIALGAVDDQWRDVLR